MNTSTEESALSSEAEPIRDDQAERKWTLVSIDETRRDYRYDTKISRNVRLEDLVKVAGPSNEVSTKHKRFNLQQAKGRVTAQSFQILVKS